MRVVITGVAGFLGSHLCDALLAGSHSVVGIDNLSMGRRENIAHHLGHPSFRFHRADVTTLRTVRRLCEGAEVIVHLAARKIPRYGGALETLLINTRATINVLEAARGNGAKVVLASTSDVYGKNPHLPFHEESDLVMGPSTVRRWSYAVSKLFDEQLCFAYQETHGFPVVLLRFFGAYGPRHHLSWWGGPPSVFISAALTGQEMEIHGDGLQTRTFSYVSDTIDGIVAAMAREAANGQIINLGDTREISILDLAHLIHELCGVPGRPRLRFVPYSSFTGARYEDVRRRVPDVTKARELLGVEPKVSLEEGLRRTIAWQRQELAKAKAPRPLARAMA